jgi:UDP-glucose 4-epimerase
MKACVIGGNGFIGSHVTDRLLEDNWNVTVLDRYEERYRAPLSRVEYAIGDLGNRGVLHEILPHTDVVFHLASTTIPQSSNDAPVFDIQTNLVDTIGLLEACVQHQVKKIVFFSSGGTVYGIPKTMLVSEDHPTNPISSYGIVKLAIEKYLHLYHHLFGLSYTILRPSNPFGERQNPTGAQGVISVFLGRVARDLPIVVWGDGTIVRDYLDVDDLANAAKKAAVTVTENNVFNISSGCGVSLNELIELIRSVTHKHIQVNYLPARPSDVPSIVLDPRRAHEELGWAPKTSFHDSIEKTWEWVKSLKRLEGGG